jgi:septal ring factor EnvC (AmiA/AmiB activator)
MTPEERERYDRIDRVLECVANSQAEVSARLAELSARQAELSARQEKTSAELDKLKEITAMHTVQIEAQGKQMGELGDFVLRLGHIVEEQASAQARTDERLNSLITVVERLFSNGHK